MIRRHGPVALASMVLLGAGIAIAGEPGWLDGGGGVAAGPSCTLNGSLGGIGGVASAGTMVVKAGLIGQLFEVTNLVVRAAPDSAPEGAGSQLSGLAALDDDTVVALAGSSIVWSAAAYPVSAIGADGRATLGPVYADASAVVTGRYLGGSGAAVVWVLNANPDDFGLYAGDQVPDAWQVQYFGVNNPGGQGAATNATGRSNLYAYTADLDPNDPGSQFEILAASNAPPVFSLCIPASSNRQYRLEWTTNMLAGGWTNTPGAVPVSGPGGPFWMSDTNSASTRLYRVEVRVP